MSAPVTLLLIVGLGGGEIQPGQLRATLNAQLDSRLARVELRKAEGATEGAVEAAALRGPVAVVTNPRPGRLEVRLALQPGQWVARAFTFERQDPLKERNRTLALALAAMMPEWRLPVPLPEPEADENDNAVPMLSEPEPVDAGAPAPVEAPAVLVADAGFTAETAVIAVPPRSPQDGLALEAGVGAAVWPPVPSALIGGGYCAGPFCVGAQLRGTRSEIGDARAIVWHLAPAVTGRAQRLVRGEWLRVAVVLALGPGWTLAQRNAQAQDRWQFEASLDAEISARAASTLWVFLRGGLAVVSGATPILVNDRQVAELPPVWGQAAAGIRFGP